jgi:leucyl-tRNA synthetase
MQREWIGKSEGAEIDFDVAGHAGHEDPRVHDAARHAVRRVVHGAVARASAGRAITTPAQRGAVEAYQKAAASKSELERTDLAKDKSGVWTGAYAQNPLFRRTTRAARIPVWIADYVIVTYGTGAIMAVPAATNATSRSRRSSACRSRHLRAEVGRRGARRAIARGETVLHATTCRSGRSNADGSLSIAGLGMAAAKRKVAIDWLVKRGPRRRRSPTSCATGCSRGSATGASRSPCCTRRTASNWCPMRSCRSLLPHMDDFKPGGVPESPLIRAKDWVATKDSKGRPAQREINTMPGAAGSSWYFLRFCDPHNEREFCSKAASDYWLPVDLYVGGTEHAVGHLLYSRFWTKVLHDQGRVRSRSRSTSSTTRG